MMQEDINNDGVPTPGEQGTAPEGETPVTEAPSVSPEEETVVAPPAPQEDAGEPAPAE